MDIEIYQEIYEGLKAYMAQKMPSVAVLQASPARPTPPLVVFTEVQNRAITRNHIDRISTIGYRAAIFAETKNGKLNMTIAREIAKEVNDYLINYVHLGQTSLNTTDNVGVGGKLARVDLLYAASYYENGRKIL